MNIVNRIISTIHPPNITSFARQVEAVTKANYIVRFTYYVLLFLAFKTVQERIAIPLEQRNFDPLWPIFWMRYAPFQTGVSLILGLYLATATISALFFQYRWSRILVLLGILQWNALESSFGWPSNQWLPWVYTLFFFCFIPGQNQRQTLSEAKGDKNKIILLVVWAAQALFLLTYSLAGFWKVWAAVFQIARGEVHAFAPFAFALQITGAWSIGIGHGILSNFIVNNPYVGWPLYIGAVYLQVFALWAAFRPSLQRLWAAGLILFHIGTFFILNIDFAPHVLLLTLLFFNSPFLPAQSSWKTLLHDLPLFGIILKRIIR